MLKCGLLLFAVLVMGIAQAQAIGRVVFTLDDAEWSQCTDGLPGAIDWKIPGTLFVISGKIGTKGYMDWDCVRKFQKAGWTIGCHTESHPDLKVLSRKKDYYGLSREMWACLGTVLQETKVVPVMFASPFGQFDDTVLAFVKRHFKFHFKAWEEDNRIAVNDYPVEDPLRIRRLEVKRQDRPEKVCSTIETFARMGKLIVLMFHQISDLPPPAGQEQWVLEKYKFEAILACVARLREKSVLVTQTAEEALIPAEAPTKLVLPEVAAPAIADEEATEVAASTPVKREATQVAQRVPLPYDKPLRLRTTIVANPKAKTDAAQIAQKKADPTSGNTSVHTAAKRSPALQSIGAALQQAKNAPTVLSQASRNVRPVIPGR